MTELHIVPDEPETPPEPCRVWCVHEPRAMGAWHPKPISIPCLGDRGHELPHWFNATWTDE